MADLYVETLESVFAEVLEQLAFMFADPPESEDPALQEDIVVATMSFHNAAEGLIQLVVPRSMGPILAANVLGLDPDDEMVTRAPYDALKELLNVTCGNVLTAIAGDEPVFDLTVPEIAEQPRESWEGLRSRENTVFCLVDDYPVLLHLESSGFADT